jgi:predicted RND superfamily exporter protein
MITALHRLIVRRHLLIVLVATVVFVFFAIQVPRVRIDNSVDNFLAHDHLLNRNSRHYDAVFGPGSGIIVAVETPDLWTVAVC